MHFFGLIFCSIYALVQFYLFRKIRVAFPSIGFWSVPVVVFMGMMIFAPFGVRMLESAGHLRLALALSTPAHSWLAIMLWFVTLSVASDTWNITARWVARVLPAMRRLVVPPRAALAITGVLVVAAGSWGMHEAADVRIKELTVTLRSLPAGSAPIRLVQVSDMHIGLFMREKMLIRVVDLIRQARPDVLVSTGDLVDSSFYQQKLAVHLASVKPPLGKYAVLGNHEFYAGLAGSLAFHRAAGFRVLRGESVQAAPGLRITGVDDPSGGEVKGDALLDGEFASAPPGEATILLKHRPRVEKTPKRRFDLQLSGHSHGGQIFPWGYVLRFIDSYTAGLHELPGGSELYVSRGTGTWGPPMRLFAPPEVTLIILQPPAAAK